MCSFFLVPASTPVISSESKLIDNDLYVTEGQNVIVSCSAKGKPAPDVKLLWKNVTIESFYLNVSKDLGKINELDKTTSQIYFIASRTQHGMKIQCLTHNNKSETRQSQPYIHIYVQCK